MSNENDSLTESRKRFIDEHSNINTEIKPKQIKESIFSKITNYFKSYFDKSTVFVESLLIT